MQPKTANRFAEVATLIDVASHVVAESKPVIKTTSKPASLRGAWAGGSPSIKVVDGVSTKPDKENTARELSIALCSFAKTVVESESICRAKSSAAPTKPRWADISDDEDDHPAPTCIDDVWN